MKRKIVGSEFADPDPESSVCSHLQPILDLLAESGNSFDRSAPMNRSRGGATRLVTKPIDFTLIEATFEVPAFIELDRPREAVICRRCWCDISRQSVTDP